MLTCMFFNCFSFEFVKASGTEIFPVNLPEGQEMTGKILKHIYHQQGLSIFVLSTIWR